LGSRGKRTRGGKKGGTKTIPHTTLEKGTKEKKAFNQKTWGKGTQQNGGGGGKKTNGYQHYWGPQKHTGVWC